MGGPGDEATRGVAGHPWRVLLVQDDFSLASVSFLSSPHDSSLPGLPSCQPSSALDMRVLGSPQAKGHALGPLVFCASSHFSTQLPPASLLPHLHLARVSTGVLPGGHLGTVGGAAR